MNKIKFLFIFLFVMFFGPVFVNASLGASLECDNAVYYGGDTVSCKIYVEDTDEDKTITAVTASVVSTDNLSPVSFKAGSGGSGSLNDHTITWNGSSTGSFLLGTLTVKIADNAEGGERIGISSPSFTYLSGNTAKIEETNIKIYKPFNVNKKKDTSDEDKKKAEEEARKKAEEEARRKAQEEAQKKAQEEAQKKAEEDAKKKAQEEANNNAINNNNNNNSETINNPRTGTGSFVIIVLVMTLALIVSYYFYNQNNVESS